MPQNVFKEHPVKTGIAFFCILLFFGLKISDLVAPVGVSGWNAKQVARIDIPDPEDFTFAVLGDNKGDRSTFEPLLRDIGRDREIAFAIDVGDLVDGGQKGNFRRFFNQLKGNLKTPFLSAIGNHDLDRGSGNYRNLFGPTHYAFQLGQASFLVLDATTESGFDKEERRWLEKELQKSRDSGVRFVFMHVPPFDPRGIGFNKCLPEKDGKDLLDLFRRYRVTRLFASHLHGYYSGVWEGVSYTITGGAGGVLQGSDPEHFFHHYVKVRLANGEVETTVKRIDAKISMKNRIGFNGRGALEWGLLAAAGVCLLALAMALRRDRG